MGYGGIVNDIADPFGLGNTSGPGVPNAGKVGNNYLNLIQGFSQGQPTIFGAEATYKPQYTALDLSQLATAMPSIAAMFSNALPSATATVTGANPGQAGLLNTLTQSATDQLNAGSNLDPQLTRLFQQSTRGAQAARGLGYGPSDVFNESLGLTEFGNTLRQQREQFAGSVAGMNNAYETQPTLQLLTNMMSPALSVSQGSGPTVIPPSQSYDTFNTAYNARAAANIDAANNAAAANNSY